MDRRGVSRRNAVRALIVAGAVLGFAPILEAHSQAEEREASSIGQELAIPTHLTNGDEFRLPTYKLIAFGKALFMARWTTQEGQGRPLTKGTGHALTDPSSPLVFPRNFNPVSGPDTGSCSRCHNRPLIGGGGDFAGNVPALAERFDFATFGIDDAMPTRGAVDELSRPVTLQSIGNLRKVVGMFGSGYVEMLARDMTRELQAQAAACALGTTCTLVAKQVNFGQLTHRADDSWDVSQVVGLPAPSLVTNGTTPPNLLIRPLHQSGHTVSLRQFTNDAFNQHHGIQSEERFGTNVDQDGDGFVNELTRADMTAVTLFQATLPVPGRVIPRDPRFRAAIANGERLFENIGCASCHVPKLPLANKAWVYSEPNPYNPPGNLRVSDGVASVSVDLTHKNLPLPRLPVEHGVVMVPAYTDLKLHDITSGLPSCASNPHLINSQQCDGDVDALDQNEPAGTAKFYAGNSKFITRKLWGIANQHAFGHHGQYTTMREAILAHRGEATSSSDAFKALTSVDQGAVVEFLKSLQILPPGTKCLVVDENYACNDR